ncbi:MAG: hypothetical protein HOL01_07485 [Planctomycetaceae bacterium]|nr:hypothetical protein [Planctomycetaceae bacterium]MBT6486909.1 hypothetical protein [Planctomycetaceae bacterium]MBT6494380.1 hypothetical protein [Planctomycetaceae bacterium]
MSTGFAGSRCQDERRRRRLAGEADDYDFDDESSSSRDDDGSRDVDSIGDEGEMPPGDVRVSHFPLGRLISPKLWKLWALGVLGLLVGGNLLLAGTTSTVGDTQFGPGFAHLFDLAAGRAVKPFATLLLLVSTQLAWFIWWVRSQSPRDFDGRFRQWGWCVAIGMGATLAIAADLHLAWAKTAMWLWEPEFWHAEVAVWLLPICLAAAWVLRTLHREMRDCRSSLSMLWMATACGVCIAVLQLNVVTISLPSDENRLMSWGLELSACWLLFMSLLLHARHVVHVTPDPAQIRPPMFRLTSMLRLPKMPKRKKQAKAATVADNPADESIAAVTAEEKTKKPAKRKQKPAPVKVAAEDVPTPPPVEEELPTTDEAVADEVFEEPPTEPETLSADDEENAEAPASIPTDVQSMKGLTKRERRRLRKQQKEAERAAKSQGRAA